MYKTILVPLDGSNRAEAILPHIVTLLNAPKQTGPSSPPSDDIPLLSAIWPIDPASHRRVQRIVCGMTLQGPVRMRRRWTTPAQQRRNDLGCK
jgi:hypothetical protein